MKVGFFEHPIKVLRRLESGLQNIEGFLTGRAAMFASEFDGIKVQCSTVAVRADAGSSSRIDLGHSDLVGRGSGA